MHCCNHALDLTIQEIGRRYDFISNTLAVVKGVSNFILDSKTRKGKLSDTVHHPRLENGDETDAGKLTGQALHLLPLCTTCLCVIVAAMIRFLENYGSIYTNYS